MLSVTVIRNIIRKKFYTKILRGKQKIMKKEATALEVSL